MVHFVTFIFSTMSWFRTDRWISFDITTEHTRLSDL